MQIWDDSQKLSENCLASHAVFEEDCLSLNGRWRFLALEADQPLPEGYFQPTFSSKHWDMIPVPSSWEETGYTQGYFNGSKPNPTLFPRGKKDAIVDPSAGKIGIYRRRFQLREDWNNRSIILRFSQVCSGFRVWMNGEPVGMSKGALGAVEFDVTQVVQPGYNYICVEVWQYTDASALDTAGSWSLSGILGDVVIYALPRQRITDLTAHASLGDQPGDVVLRVCLTAENADGLTARVAVMDEDKVCYYGEGILSEGKTSVVISCKGAKLWSCEHPALYKIAVILWDGIGICHTRQIRFGFRELRREGRQILLNRQRLHIRGVCYNPSDLNAMEQDVLAIRQAHFNSVRVSASMPERFYDLCDRFGLYVLDDCCDSRPDPRWDDLRRDRAIRMVQSHRSHPCVILWHSGADAELLRELDDSRLVCGEDLYCVSFPSLQRMEQIARGEDLVDTPTGLARMLSSPAAIPACAYQDLPVLALNYGGTPGNTALSVTEYARRLAQDPAWAGGFYFQFRDLDLFGCKDPASAVGLIRRDGVPHHLYHAFQKINQQIFCRWEDGCVHIENGYQFRSLADFLCGYQITRDGVPIDEGLLELDVPAGGTDRVPIPMPESMYLPGRYHLTLKFLYRQDAVMGDGCAAYFQWELANNRSIIPLTPGGVIRDDGSAITLRSESVCYTIDRSTGNVTQITRDGQSLLREPLAPVFYRVKTDTELSKSRRLDEWGKLSLKGQLPKPSVVEVNHMAHQVTIAQNIGSGLMRRYQLNRDGSLTVELRLRTGKNAPSRIGMQLSMDLSFDRIQWTGMGPYDTYPDRSDCGTYGIHRQSVLEQDEFLRPQEHGCKTQTVSVHLTDEASDGLHIRSEEPLSFCVWPYSLNQMQSGDTTPSQTTLTLICDQNGLEQMRLQPHSTYTFTFTISPIDPA